MFLLTLQLSTNLLSSSVAYSPKHLQVNVKIFWDNIEYCLVHAMNLSA